MNYASGLMMGAAIGQNIRNIFAGGSAKQNPTPPAFTLVSAQPGRRRYRARIGEELAALLEQKLSMLDFIESVAVRPSTGSILITYDPKCEGIMDSVASFLAERVFSTPQSGVKKACLRPRPTSAHTCADHKATNLPQAHSVMGSIVMHSLHQFLKGISEWIRIKTNNWLDFTSLLFLTLIITGIRRIILEGGRISGFQLFWWGITILRGRIYRDM